MSSNYIFDAPLFYSRTVAKYELCKEKVKKTGGVQQVQWKAMQIMLELVLEDFANCYGEKLDLTDMSLKDLGVNYED